jgi:hypothetical protein
MIFCLAPRNLAYSIPKLSSLGTIPGNGVYVAAIQRAASAGLFTNVLVATSASAKQSALYDGLQKIAASTIDDPGLDQSPTAQLNLLKEALAQYAAAPDNATLAQAATASAKDMATSLNQATQTVQSTREGADADIATSVANINQLLTQFEAFRKIYADERLDFRKLARYDLSILTTAIKQRVNERMRADIVQDVMVEDFNYVSREEFQRKP